MSTPRIAVRTTLALAGIASVGLLAACSSASANDASSPAATADSSTAATSASTGAASTTSATYKDGTYTETGDYQTPGGAESVTVKLAVKDDVVTAVSVTGSGRDANSQHYQAAFEGGVAAVVVGKKLATLDVGAVAGSSLTPNGFNAAVAKIRSDAKA